MADRKLDVLEERLTALENIVFGSADKDCLFPKCIDGLTTIHNKIFASVAGRKKIVQMYSKLPLLEKHLNPAITDNLTLSSAAKVDIILSEEKFLNDQVARLEQVKKLEEFINSEHIKAVPTMSPRLHELSQLQIKQQDEESEFTEETRRLMSAYKSLIAVLSQQFVQWDDTITRLEIAAHPKKTLD